MQPSPSADTSRSLFPSLRFFIRDALSFRKAVLQVYSSCGHLLNCVHATVVLIHVSYSRVRSVLCACANTSAFAEHRSRVVSAGEETRSDNQNFAGERFSDGRGCGCCPAKTAHGSPGCRGSERSWSAYQCCEQGTD